MKIKNLKKVDKHLYRSGKIKPIDVMVLKDMGIKTIISLDDIIGNEILDACKKLDINHLILPIDIENNKTVRNILNDDFLSTIQDNGPTLVHCKAGKDRTGLVVAVYCLMNGKPISQVKKDLFYFGFGIGLPTVAKDYYLKVINEVDRTFNKKDKLKSDSQDSLVQYSRSYLDSSDPSASYLEAPLGHTFAPYLDYQTDYPYETRYPENIPKEYSREYFEKNRNKKNPETETTSKNKSMPSAGLYYNGISNTNSHTPFDMSGIFND